MNEIAGSLTLIDAARDVATLQQFQLIGDSVTFTLDVALPDAWATRTVGRPSLHDHDASLSVRWDSEAPPAQVLLRIPTPGVVMAAGRPIGSVDVEPTLRPIRGSQVGSHWQQQLSFGPLPDGELTFIFTSDALGVRRAVAVVPVADLRGRVIQQRGASG